jgi:polysaccharide export outer membrane protein
MALKRNNKHTLSASSSKNIVCAMIFIPAMLSLSACAPNSGLATLPPPTDDNYHLGPGDQIRVITYDEPQLTNTFTIGEGGQVSFPLIGAITAAGETPNQFAADVAAALQQSKLISQPSVSVEIVQYRPISVLGEVNHPGQYPYQPGMTTLDAVALAGGFTYRAVTDSASDWRSGGQGSGAAVEGKIGPGSKLQPGDVITISERYF